MDNSPEKLIRKDEERMQGGVMFDRFGGTRHGVVESSSRCFGCVERLRLVVNGSISVFHQTMLLLLTRLKCTVAIWGGGTSVAVS